MRNKEVVEAFMKHKCAKTAHLESTGTHLCSYNCCIAEWYDGMLLYNDNKYSVTTSRHQGLLRRAIPKNYLYNKLTIGGNSNNLQSLSAVFETLCKEEKEKAVNFK